jgi:transposase-like protein
VVVNSHSVHDSSSGSTHTDHLTRPERENSELRAETAFLKKAALDSNRQRNTKQFMVEVDDG